VQLTTWLKDYGLGTFLVLYGLWFWQTKAWPFITEVWQKSNQDRMNLESKARDEQTGILTKLSEAIGKIETLQARILDMLERFERQLDKEKSDVQKNTEFREKPPYS